VYKIYTKSRMKIACGCCGAERALCLKTKALRSIACISSVLDNTATSLCCFESLSAWLQHTKDSRSDLTCLLRGRWENCGGTLCTAGSLTLCCRCLRCEGKLRNQFIPRQFQDYFRNSACSVFIRLMVTNEAWSHAQVRVALGASVASLLALGRAIAAHSTFAH
jgi:hypothetical protein